MQQTDTKHKKSDRCFRSNVRSHPIRGLNKIIHFGASDDSRDHTRRTLLVAFAIWHCLAAEYSTLLL